jgi:hypothetical protein
MSDRTPCINPRCRRTFKPEGSTEFICGKCFKLLPEATRKGHRAFWRDLRKWDKRILRTSDDLKIVRMRAIRDRIAFNLGTHWDIYIKHYYQQPGKPEGLDAFLEEVGL